MLCDVLKAQAITAEACTFSRRLSRALQPKGEGGGGGGSPWILWGSGSASDYNASQIAVSYMPGVTVFLETQVGYFSKELHTILLP